MHDKNSKRLPVRGPDHSYKISELKNVQYHEQKAKEHYQEVKRNQCIADYNIAVDNLSELYDNIMLAQEAEEELKAEMTEVKNQISGMKKLMQKASDRLLLCKAKLQQVGISINELKKVKPVSQGTQIDEDIQITGETPANIVEIPEDESDLAAKALIAAELEGKELNIATTQDATIFGQNFTVTTSTTPAVPRTTANIVTLPSMTQSATNYIITMQNTGSSLLVTPQNVIQHGTIPQNVIQGTVPISIPPGATVQDLVPVSDIPQGFKKTKFSDTLEKIDLSTPTAGQKAPKRFFCVKCMSQGVQTDYTKKNDLNKHLEGCGKEKEKKHHCTYEGCDSSFIRFDNLRQHVAKVHTKEFLYKCKKCGRGFYTSPEASSHRRMCTPITPGWENITEDINKGEEEDNNNQERPFGKVRVLTVL